MDSAAHAALSKVFLNWLVHGQSPVSDNGPEVVDGES